LEGHERVLQFSADGRRLAVATPANELAIYDVAPSTVFREFQGQDEARSEQGMYVDTSPDGRLVATADAAGLRLWDARTGRQILDVPEAKSLWTFVLFHPDGQSLLCSLVNQSLVNQGCFRRALTWTSIAGRQTVELGPRESVGAKTDYLVGFTPAGNWLVTGAGPKGGHYLWPHGDATRRRKYADRDDRGATMPNVSPDEKYAAIYISPGQVQLWSVADARLIQSLPGGPFTAACFTRDGQWLVTGTEHEVQLWEAGTWRFVRTLATGLQRGDFADLFFSPDGKLMILQATDERFQIRSLPGFVELVNLEAPLPLARICTEWSKDSQRFYILGASNRLFEWNLAALRDELAKLGLDWTTPK
jgi:WD40 repeat protein